MILLGFALCFLSLQLNPHQRKASILSLCFSSMSWVFCVEHSLKSSARSSNIFKYLNPYEDSIFKNGQLSLTTLLAKMSGVYCSTSWILLYDSFYLFLSGDVEVRAKEC